MWGDVMRRRCENWGDSLSAYLVTNSRDGKRVWQKVVCYLGAVNEKTTLGDRLGFWKHAIPKLNALNLSETERAQIEASSAKRCRQLRVTVGSLPLGFLDRLS